MWERLVQQLELMLECVFVSRRLQCGMEIWKSYMSILAHPDYFFFFFSEGLTWGNPSPELSMKLSLINSLMKNSIIATSAYYRLSLNLCSNFSSCMCIFRHICQIIVYLFWRNVRVYWISSICMRHPCLNCWANPIIFYFCGLIYIQWDVTIPVVCLLHLSPPFLLQCQVGVSIHFFDPAFTSGEWNYRFLTLESSVSNLLARFPSSGVTTNMSWNFGISWSLTHQKSYYQACYC